MIHQSIARRYAKGLFAVGERDGNYVKYHGELEKVIDLFQTEKRVGRALLLPILEINKRKEILADILKVLDISASTSNMFSMLLEKNRMEYLTAIKDQYEALLDEKEGRMRGVIWSAYPISDNVKGSIEEALKKKMEKDVLLDVVEDKELIGGLKVRIGGTIIDGSVKRQLEILRENILKE